MVNISTSLAIFSYNNLSLQKKKKKQQIMYIVNTSIFYVEKFTLECFIFCLQYVLQGGCMTNDYTWILVYYMYVYVCTCARARVSE